MLAWGDNGDGGGFVVGEGDGCGGGTGYGDGFGHGEGCSGLGGGEGAGAGAGNGRRVRVFELDNMLRGMVKGLVLLAVQGPDAAARHAATEYAIQRLHRAASMSGHDPGDEHDGTGHGGDHGL